MLCPKCGADWNTLKECAMTRSGNFILGKLIVDNCKVCMRHVGHWYYPTEMSFDQFATLEVMPATKIKVVK